MEPIRRWTVPGCHLRIPYARTVLAATLLFVTHRTMIGQRIGRAATSVGIPWMVRLKLAFSLDDYQALPN